MRVVIFVLGWLVASGARAQPAPGTWIEPGTQVTPSDPPEVGACIGGSCAASLREPPSRPRRAGDAAYGGALFGTASAGLVFGGALAIALVDDLHSERVSRGVWLGYVAVSAPIVALTSHLTRRGGKNEGFKSLRALGWTAYSAAIAGGVVQWYGAFHEVGTPLGFTVTLGVLGAFALLPHALDAFMAGHHARLRRFLRQARAAPGGLALRF